MAKGIGVGKKKAPGNKKEPAVQVNKETKTQEAIWRAESDARTLMRAEEIKRDPVRIKAAQNQARKQIKELEKVVKK